MRIKVLVFDTDSDQPIDADLVAEYTIRLDTTGFGSRWFLDRVMPSGDVTWSHSLADVFMAIGFEVRGLPEVEKAVKR